MRFPYLHTRDRDLILIFYCFKPKPAPSRIGISSFKFRSRIRLTAGFYSLPNIVVETAGVGSVTSLSHFFQILFYASSISVQDGLVFFPGRWLWLNISTVREKYGD